MSSQMNRLLKNSKVSASNQNHRAKMYNNNDDNVPIIQEKNEVEDIAKCGQCLRFKYRIQWKFFKILLGIAMSVISLIFLVMNEKKASQISKSYHEGLGSICILENSFNILPDNNGKLVYVNGYLSISEALEETIYGVSIYAVKLKRRVQLYQWVEEKISQPQAVFGQSPYRYSKMWRDKLVNSSEFSLPTDHENPKQLPLTSETRINPNVRLGSFSLGPELKEKFNNFIQFTSGERPNNSQIKMHMGLYYHSADIWHPKVGDVRLQFSFAGQADTYISVIAMQDGEDLKPFLTESGIWILYLYEGRINHLEIFKNEHASLIYRSWYIRTIIWIIVSIGVFLSMRIIIYLNRRNYIVKKLMSVGPFKLSLTLSSCLTLCTIGCIWLSYKPVFGFLLVSLSCCLMFYYVIAPAETETAKQTHSASGSTNKKYSSIPNRKQLKK